MTSRRRYLEHLEQDLDRWIAKGWVPSIRRDEILSDAGAWQPAPSAGRMAAMLTLLGALLVGAGAIAFVAANWAEMGRGDRLAVLFASMTAAFAGGWWFLGRGGRPQVGQGLILLGVILFGADIHLVAQTYQIQAHYPDGVLLWAAGALLTAAVVPSAPSLWLAFGLVGLWSVQEMVFADITLHLPFLPAWGLAVATAVAYGWWRCLGFGLLVFAGWYGLSGIALLDLTGLGAVEVAALLLVLPLVLWVLGDAVPRVGDILHGLGLIGTLLGAAVIAQPDLEVTEPLLLAATQAVAIVAVAAASLWARPSTLRRVLALAAALLPLLRVALPDGSGLAGWGMIAAYMALVIALAVLGRRDGSRITRHAAYAAFALHILTLYASGVMSLLSLFVFFTVVGAALVVTALRLEKRT